MSDEPQARVARWQDRLLPFMSIAIVLMAVFFFAASVWQLTVFRKETHVTPPELSVLSKRAGQPDVDIDFKTRAELEVYVINRRYEQVRGVMLLRAWTRYVGFLTGMILALVGSLFVLGKIGAEGEGAGATEVSAEGAGVKAGVKSPYPGVALAGFGTLLMGMAIAVPFEFDVDDGALYIPKKVIQGLEKPAPPSASMENITPEPTDAAAAAEEDALFGPPVGPSVENQPTGGFSP